MGLCEVLGVYARDSVPAFLSCFGELATSLYPLVSDYKCAVLLRDAVLCSSVIYEGLLYDIDLRLRMFAVVFLKVFQVFYILLYDLHIVVIKIKSLTLLARLFLKIDDGMDSNHTRLIFR